jgi:hypothetical protein
MSQFGKRAADARKGEAVTLHGALSIDVDQCRSMATNGVSSERSALKVRVKVGCSPVPLKWIHKTVKRVTLFHLLRRCRALFQKVKLIKTDTGERSKP